ncbi:MAG: TRAP transporter substrate-binding protein [Rhodospirillaceae bacterium]|nr:TRAP transporter substrate-binding protein [Rhodospirillaceae bacterium]
MLRTIGFATALAVAAGAAQAETVTLRYNNWIPPTHFFHKEGMLKYFDDVAKATGGRIKIVSTAQSLGAPPRQMQLAADGIADITWGVHSYTPGTYPLAEMVELPFIGHGSDKDSVAYWRVYKAMFEKTGMHPAAVHTLAVHVHPPGHIYNNKRAIKTVDDLKGLKLRAANATTTAVFQKFGATPLSMPATQARDALSKGVADGTMFTSEAIINWNIQDFTKYATIIEGGLYSQSFFVVINKKKWESLPAADRAAMEKLSYEALAKRLGTLWQNEENVGLDKLRKLGVEVTIADAAMMGKLHEALAPVEKAWIEKAKAKGVDGAAAIAMFKAEATKQ